MKLIDLSYFKYGMTSLEEIEIENYRRILTFIENYEIKNSEVDLSFLNLPNVKIGYVNNQRHLAFSIGKVTGLFIYNEGNKEFFLKSNKLHSYENNNDIKTFLEDIPIPYVIAFSSLTQEEKEAIYHVFMVLRKENHIYYPNI